MPTPLDLETLDPAAPAAAEDTSDEAAALQDHKDDMIDHIEDILGENEPLAGTDEDVSTSTDSTQEGAADTGEKRNDQVPLATFMEEKGRTKALKEELDGLRDKFTTMETFKTQYEQQQEELQKQLEAKANPPVEYDEDPQAYVDQQLQALRVENERLVAIQTEAAQQQANQDALATFKTQLSAQVNEFVGTHPDFSAAQQLVRENKRKELVATGVVDSATQDQLLNEWELHFSYNAMNNGANPGEQIYNLAKGYGFGGAAPNNSQINTIKEGQASNTNLGTGGNSDTTDENEGKDEFEAAFASVFSHLHS